VKLLLENWRKYLDEISLGTDPTKSIEYTAFVLDEASRRKLVELAPGGWKIYADHMTMIPPAEMKQRLPTEQFFEGCLAIDGIVQNDKVMTARVNLGENVLYFKIEGLPHIPIATAVDESRTKDPESPKYYSPALSNEFTDNDFQLIEPVEVCGKVKEVVRRNQQE